MKREKLILSLFFLPTLILVVSGFFFDIQIVHSQTNDTVSEISNVTPGTNIVVETVPKTSITHTVLEKTKNSWPWYVTRASGLLAGLLLIILVLSGVGFITGTSFRFLQPITAWATHKALGIAFTISVLAHIGSLYFDHFVEFDLKSLLIPFVSNFKETDLFGYHVGSLYVALGIFALYILLAVVFTSLFWIEKKPKTWKSVHVFSYVAMLFVFVHALFIGTDLSHGTLRYIWIVFGALTLFATLLRIWRVKTV